MADNDAPGAWPIWTTGSGLAGIIKGLTKHCFTLNIKALGLMVSEKKIVSYFSHLKPMLDNDATGAWPIWVPGTRLAGFMKGVTRH